MPTTYEGTEPARPKVAEIEAAARAAEVSERALFAAAEVLGVRIRKGRWWIPRTDRGRITDEPNLSRADK